VWRLRVVLKATCVATESGVAVDLYGDYEWCCRRLVWRLRVVLKATCVATTSGVEGDVCGD
jgi:hypothetical protein